MNVSVTRFLSALLLVLGLTATTVVAQAGPELGDDFIFFVNGTNTLIPDFDGEVVDDPDDASNKVVMYAYSDWGYSAFRFESSVGVDLSQNREDGDIVSFRLRVDPENAGKPNVRILFEDKSDGSSSMDPSVDLPFRLSWDVPQTMQNGEWHDVEIELPPATYQELEAAKSDGSLTGLARNWKYTGAWSPGNFGVGIMDEMGPATADNPNLWQEFEWTNVAHIGFHFDNNQGGGDVFIDNLYIGSSDLDISVAEQPGDAAGQIDIAGTAEGNTITWTHNPSVGGYNVYLFDPSVSGFNPLELDIASSGAIRLGMVPATADDFEFLHRVEIPHLTLQTALPLFYAVTTLSGFGVENPDIRASFGQIINMELPVQPSVVQLTESEANMLRENLLADRASMEGFPESVVPFLINQGHFTLGDASTPPDSDMDNSAQVCIGYTDNNELFVYAEVTDDEVQFAPQGTGGGDTFNFDSVELGWGNYSLLSVDEGVEGGGIFVGSPHQDIVRGDDADYTFRMAGFAEGGGSTYVGWSLNAEAPDGKTVVEVVDGGYNLLSVIPLDKIQAEGDIVVPPPAEGEFRIIPMIIVLNDRDGGSRQHQITWSIKHNTDGAWWNTPAQWPAVSMTGREPITIDTEGEAEVPENFVLEQNYPNPFNPTTAIRFSLPTSERVTLVVYDMLGRTVATLVNDTPMPAGEHSVRFGANNLASGIYLYRLQAGSSFQQSRQMLLLK